MFPKMLSHHHFIKIACILSARCDITQLNIGDFNLDCSEEAKISMMNYGVWIGDKKIHENLNFSIIFI